MLGTVARGTRNNASTPNRCDQIVVADDAGRGSTEEIITALSRVHWFFDA